MTRSAGWLREERADAATAKILDGAGAAFADLGLAQTGMADVARFAGCSRATVYRYFPTRGDLYLAFVNREAMRINARLGQRLRDVADREQRVVQAILGAVREVRANPTLAAWFEPEGAGLAFGVGGTSQVVHALAMAFVERFADVDPSGLSASFLVRIILSLLTMPGQDDAEEEALVTRFVAPAILRGGALPA